MSLVKISPVVFLLEFAFLIPSEAHNLEAEIQVDRIEFTVRAYFEDGTAVGSATAEVVAADGDILAVGKTDEEGRFTFAHNLKEKFEVAVEDDTGHRETFPLSPAAIALAIRGEAAELEHTHGEEEHDHHHEHGDEEGHDHAAEAEDGQSPHDGHDHGADNEKTGLVLTKEGGSSQTNRVVSGLGYVLGITGILFYILGFRQKAGA